jgi:hypothetical protein
LNLEIYIYSLIDFRNIYIYIYISSLIEYRRQIKYLDTHPSVSIVGGAIKIFGNSVQNGKVSSDEGKRRVEGKRRHEKKLKEELK